MAKGLAVNGLRVAKARMALPGRVTQAEFARRLGIHWVTQSNIENGKANVSLELLERISSETGMPRDHFTANGDEDDEEADPVADLTDAIRRLVRDELRKKVTA